MLKYLCFIVLFTLSAPWLKTNTNVFEADTNNPAMQRAARIKGIFSFGMGRNFPSSQSLQLEYISGMSSIFTWADMEPAEGKYDFTEIDRQVEWASKNKKLLNICLYAGNKSPAWLPAKGIPMIQWKRRWREDQAKLKQASHEIENAPTFWDTNYLNQWKIFVSTLAKRYNSNPTIGYISLTGPTPKDLSTGTVIRYDADWNKVVEAGYTYQKHLAAWRSMIDHYVKEFPNKISVLALGPLRPGSSDLTLSEDLIDYILEKEYKNVQFLCVILNDTWFTTSSTSIKLRNLFKRANKNGYAFGYQMVYSVQKMEKFEDSKNIIVKDLGSTLQLAIDDGASWIEVWHDDIIHPKDKIARGSTKADSKNRQHSSQLKSNSEKVRGNTNFEEQIQYAHKQLMIH